MHSNQKAHGERFLLWVMNSKKVLVSKTL